MTLELRCIYLFYMYVRINVYIYIYIYVLSDKLNINYILADRDLKFIIYTHVYI